MSCCVDTIGGAPAGGGGGGVPNRAVQITELSTTPTGTVDTSVATFVSGLVQRGTEALASWVTEVTTAANGTILTVLQPGIYHGQFLPVVIAPASWVGGVSVAATAAQLLAATPPDGTVAQYQARVDFVQGSTDTRHQLGPLVITAADIAAGDNLVRCHATNSAAAPSQFIFNLAACTFVLRQIATLA